MYLVTVWFRSKEDLSNVVYFNLLHAAQMQTSEQLLAARTEGFFCHGRNGIVPNVAEVNNGRGIEHPVRTIRCETTRVRRISRLCQVLDVSLGKTDYDDEQDES